MSGSWVQGLNLGRFWGQVLDLEFTVFGKAFRDRWAGRQALLSQGPRALPAHATNPFPLIRLSSKKTPKESWSEKR